MEVIRILQKTKNSEFLLKRNEQAKLEARLDRCREGQGSFILVTGEAGSGKSTLVRQFCSYAAAQNAICIHVQLDKDAGLDPYKPFIRAIEKHSQSNDLSEILNRDNGGNDGAELNDQQGVNIEYLLGIQSHTTIIQQNIVLALFRLAEKAPIIFSMENAHYASQTTWRFIHYLAEKISEKSIILITTLRMDGRLTTDNIMPAYSDVLQRMNRDGVIEKIRLERLTVQSIQKFLKAKYKKTDFSNQFVPKLAELSDCNFAHLIDVLKQLENKNIVYCKQGIWFDEFKQIATNKISDFSGLAANEHYASLYETFSNDVKAILEPASLFYNVIDSAILSGLSSHSRISVLKNINKLILNKVFVENEDHSFRFKDSNFKHYVCGQIDPDSQKEMHLKIAETIERTLSDSDNKTNYLAYHYLHGGDLDNAIVYLLRAAELAIRHFALSEAKILFEKIFNLESKIKSKIIKLNLIHAHVQAAWLYRVLGFYDTSLQHCVSVENNYKEETTEYVLLLNQIQKMFTLFRVQRWNDAQEIIEKYSKFTHILSPFEQSMLHYGMGNIYFETSDYTNAKKYYQQALDLAEKIRNKSLIALVMSNIATTESVSGNIMKAIAIYSKAIPIYEELGDRHGLARIYNDIGMTYADSESWQKANEFYGKSLSASDVLGLNGLKTITFLNKSIALIGMDKLDEAHEYSFKAFRLIEMFNDRLALAEYWKIKGMIAARSKKRAETEEYFEKALNGFCEFKSKLGQAEIYSEKGKYLISMGEYAPAEMHLHKAINIFNEIGARKKAKAIRDILVGIQSNHYKQAPMEWA